MKTIKVSILPIRDGENASGVVYLETKRNDYWVKEREFEIASGDPKTKERTLVVDDNQRLVIEAASDMEMIVDPEQNVARLLPRDPDMRVAVLEKEKAAADKAAAEEQEVKDKAAESARRKIEEMKRFDARAAEQRKEAFQKPVEPPKVEPPKTDKGLDRVASTRPVTERRQSDV